MTPVRGGKEVESVDELLTRMWEDLIGRVGGPMRLRFLLEPAMAALLAIRAGVTDAREHKAPYLWAVLSNPSHRSDLLHEGWKAVCKVFVIAVAIDVIYQYAVLGWFFPGEALIVAFALAFVPYLLIRGPVNRIASYRRVENS